MGPGEHYPLPGGDVFVLVDEDFLYSVRAVAALGAARALVESLEPVPRPQHAPAETFTFWAE